MHIQATERYRERMAQKRRYKRLFGVNRGIEQRGRPLDPDARLAEEEAAELTEELATSAGAGIYRVSVYLALRESDGDREALRELIGATSRELTMACDARTQHGPFAQETCGASTLPLGRDPRPAAAQVRQPQRRGQLPTRRERLWQPRRHPARLRATGPHARASGPV